MDDNDDAGEAEAIVDDDTVTGMGEDEPAIIDDIVDEEASAFGSGSASASRRILRNFPEGMAFVSEIKREQIRARPRNIFWKLLLILISNRVSGKPKSRNLSVCQSVSRAHV